MPTWGRSRSAGHQTGLAQGAAGQGDRGRWQQWARAGELPSLFEELMLRHYDPHYERSQSNHFEQWPRRQVLETDQLSDEAIAGLAQQIIAMQAR